ncbi:UNKNOWN [Stylonychia lemnae]|uniref:Uncharacterized protein n=1 Tax=Stylonychia lemnae TaxID=5949 RepID=A0A078AAE8_STYLE|nr:UNKNOWN [Stylonychia lemnae]|eukprot:CDW79240.1 UNKNOWN [Stylonychia lemnae]
MEQYRQTEVQTPRKIPSSSTDFRQSVTINQGDQQKTKSKFKLKRGGSKQLKQKKLLRAEQTKNESQINAATKAELNFKIPKESNEEKYKDSPFDKEAKFFLYSVPDFGFSDNTLYNELCSQNNNEDGKGSNWRFFYDMRVMKNKREDSKNSPGSNDFSGKNQKREKQQGVNWSLEIIRTNQDATFSGDVIQLNPKQKQTPNEIKLIEIKKIMNDMFDQFHSSQQSIQGIKELIRYRSNSMNNHVADYSTINSKIDHIWKLDFTQSQETIVEQNNGNAPPTQPQNHTHIHHQTHSHSHHHHHNYHHHY